VVGRLLSIRYLFGCDLFLAKDQFGWFGAVCLPDDFWYTTCGPPICNAAFAFDPKHVVEVVLSVALSLYTVDGNFPLEF
jgi:hypothetical protein